MDWSYIQDFLYQAGKFVFLSNFILLVIAVITERKVSSIVITLMVVALANGFMSAITPLLYDLSSRNGTLYKFAWYGGFAAINCMALYLLYKLHKMLNQNVSKVASVTGLAFLLFTCLQCARFIDRFVFDTELMVLVYRNAVPALNLVLVPLLVYFWFEEVRARKACLVEVTQ